MSSYPIGTTLQFLGHAGSLLLLSFGLVACGGSGGSDRTANNPPPALDPAPPSTPAPEPTQAQLISASRFGAQATFGLSYTDLRTLALQGNEQWLNQQLELPITAHTPIALDLLERRIAGEFEGIEEDVELLVSFRRYSWWHNSITAPDMVRQRVALALSEILVVSDRPDVLLLDPLALSTYYDTLLSGATGNFRDLLRNVTLHPAMGFYLSHVNNARTNPENNTFPDENFAREVMQLFSIGLFELNNDGSQKLAADGDPIPTYTSTDIRAFAKIFTGLSWGGDDAFFGNSEPNFVEPMQMFDEFHEPGEKRLLNGTVVPAGQSGTADLEAGIDNLFNHPNVGPFIGRQLIQRLVTSNPSNDYVERVASAFNDNGAGIRGDMKAVIRAILLDTEAANPEDRSTAGKVREPIVRNVALIRQLNPTSPNNLFFNSGFLAEFLTQQHALSAPSVFNFFLPSHMPTGPLATAGLVAPELQITNSTTIAGVTNLVDIAVNGEFPSDVEAPFTPFSLDLTEFETLAANPDDLIERLDILFTYGEMEEATKTVISDIITGLDDLELRARTAIYITLVSPDYAVQI